MCTCVRWIIYVFTDWEDKGDVVLVLGFCRSGRYLSRYTTTRLEQLLHEGFPKDIYPIAAIGAVAFALLVEIYVIARLSRSREIPTNAISPCILHIYTCRSGLRYSRQKRLFVVFVFYFLLLNRPRFRSVKSRIFI